MGTFPLEDVGLEDTGIEETGCDDTDGSEDVVSTEDTGVEEGSEDEISMEETPAEVQDISKSSGIKVHNTKINVRLHIENSSPVLECQFLPAITL